MPGKGFNGDIESSNLPEYVKRALLSYEYKPLTPEEIGQATQLWLGRYILPQITAQKESDK